MSLVNQWELNFPEAILSVEELLTQNDSIHSNKSSLRLALENNFLNGEAYLQWAAQTFECPFIKKNELDPLILEKIRNSYSKNKLIYSLQFSFLNDHNPDLILVDNWDGNLIFLGLEKKEILDLIPNSVFIFCSLELLNLIQNEKSDSALETQITDHLTALDQITKVDPFEDLLKLNLGENEEDTQKKNISLETENHSQFIDASSIENQPLPDLSLRLWKNINSNHSSYSEQVLKKFDAYVVLKINSQLQTELFKMDEDLQKENLDPNLFKFDLTQQNPFCNVYTNHYTETFNINQLHISLLDFKYACISALKLGPRVIGFLVGLKTTHLSQDDISTLESLSEKAV